MTAFFAMVEVENNVHILTRETALKKVRGNLLTIEITSNRVRGNNVNFLTIEITSKKVRGDNVDFWPSKSLRKTCVEITWIFRPRKLHRKNYVETTWIFLTSKLHEESTRKWRGNSSKFGLQRINVISMSNRCGFDVVCPLGNIHFSGRLLLIS